MPIAIQIPNKIYIRRYSASQNQCLANCGSKCSSGETISNSKVHTKSQIRRRRTLKGLNQASGGVSISSLCRIGQVLKWVRSSSRFKSRGYYKYRNSPSNRSIDFSSSLSKYQRQLCRHGKQKDIHVRGISFTYHLLDMLILPKHWCHGLHWGKCTGSNRPEICRARYHSTAPNTIFRIQR